MRWLIVLVACSAPRAPVSPPSDTVIAGSFERDRAPDGNSVVLEAPRGWIVVDTGRHPAHQAKLLAQAKQRPIVAIINTHWHLDHAGGNGELLTAFPTAEVIATTAIEGALRGFLGKSKKSTGDMLAAGEITADQKIVIDRDRARVAAPGPLRPTRAITASGTIVVGGRTLDVRVAPFAATEADLWIWDPRTKTVIAGDLVVAAVPFFDTACATGWRTALGEIDRVPFERLIPGHGAPMTHAEFRAWKLAFEHLLDCTGPVAACIAGWRADAKAFLPPVDPGIDELLTYYITEHLRATDHKFCRSLR